MKPFVVDVYSLDGHGDTRRIRLEADSLESAQRMMEIRTGLSDVTRMVVSRRIGGGGVSKMQVWTRSVA